MRELSLIVLSLFIMSFKPTDSPHGKDLNISCNVCHNPTGWKIDHKTISFKHSTTQFKLEGVHKDVNCVACHTSLVFSEAKPECMSCHEDVHEQTLGFDCVRCHTTNSWLIDNIKEIHQQSRFPLLGAHSTADCYACHINSASTLRFDPLGVRCIDCHLKDYQATTAPNHTLGQYSKECTQCHQMNAFSWSGANITHNFFPLTDGHNIKDCSKCHLDAQNYSNISPVCVSCHQNNYNNTTSPNHIQLGISTNCIDCHTTAPGWKPAKFAQHDVLFPIYSGKHNDAWSSCTDCHKVASDYAVYTCTDCHDHNKSDMDSKHSGVGGYIYESNACFSCHPTGSRDGSFNHATSNFPLTGAHATTDCASCHANGYTGTSSVCVDCHLNAYNQSTNPNHTKIGLSTDCKVCHTTLPGWKPATFDVHNQYYVIAGAHLTIANDCNACHNGKYDKTTPITCVGCHLTNYDQTTNPPHASNQFSTDCIICHTQDAWTPATFDHSSYYVIAGAHLAIANNCNACHNGKYDKTTPTTCVGCHLTNYNQTTTPPHATSQFPTDCSSCHTQNAWTPSTWDHSGYFPIYSGKHQGQWSSCTDCHNIPSDYSLFSCINCHEHNKTDTDSKHSGVANYQYNSDACYSCHPTGSKGSGGGDRINFPHNIRP